jgi:4,5-dihydroxyphthalate decarboxylase
MSMGPEQVTARRGGGSEGLLLSVGLTPNLRTRPILDGMFHADGVTMNPLELHPSELFWRQLKFAEFDIAEMSMSSLLMATARGDDRFVGLPVFSTHYFFQNWIMIRKDSGIKKPEDFAGRRIGVPEYQQTAALWSRGVLQHEFGVAPKDMEFWMERTPDISHGGSTGFEPPEGVTVNRIPPETNMGEMLLAGELDATLLYLPGGNLVDRSTADLTNHPNFGPLFDAYVEGKRYYEKTDMYPINHGMVIKREIVEEHPWVVLNIYKAFEDAATFVENQRIAMIRDHLETGLLPPEAEATLATPLVRHGVIANRKELEAITQYSFEQGLTPRKLDLEDIFPASVMDK